MWNVRPLRGDKTSPLLKDILDTWTKQTPPPKLEAEKISTQLGVLIKQNIQVQRLPSLQQTARCIDIGSCLMLNQKSISRAKAPPHHVTLPRHPHCVTLRRDTYCVTVFSFQRVSTRFAVVSFCKICWWPQERFYVFKIAHTLSLNLLA